MSSKSKKMISLDFVPISSAIQVGSHKYTRLFKAHGYDVLSLCHYLNVTKFLKSNYEDKEMVRSWARGMETDSSGIQSYVPLCLLPYLRFPLLDNVDLGKQCLRYCVPNLGKTLRSAGFDEVDVLFVNNIRLISILEYVKAKTVVFRNSDRIDGFGNIPTTIRSLQEHVVKTSDIVYATSSSLFHEAHALNANSYYLPNGVDESFMFSPGIAYIKPADIADIRTPMVLYVGAISDWFDYDLYEHGLRTAQDLSFVMIGPVSGVKYQANLARVNAFREQYSNFYYLGTKPHRELPHYLAHSAVGLIPFELLPLTHDINPIKLFEYAAFGLPVVSSAMAEIENYRDQVQIYRTPEEYIQMLGSVVQDRTRHSERMLEFARNNTWEKRFDTIFSHIEAIHE